VATWEELNKLVMREKCTYCTHFIVDSQKTWCNTAKQFANVRRSYLALWMSSPWTNNSVAVFWDIHLRIFRPTCLNITTYCIVSEEDIDTAIRVNAQT